MGLKLKLDTGLSNNELSIEPGTNNKFLIEPSLGRPSVIVLGAYGTGLTPKYSNDFGDTWTNFDVTTYTGLVRMFGANQQNIHGMTSSRDGSHLCITAVDSTSTCTTLRFFRSTDYGATWTWQDLAAGGGYYTIFAGDTDYVYFGGSFGGTTNGRGYSTNRSQSWTRQNISTNIHVSMCASVDGQYVYGGMYNGTMQRSTNYGVTWNENYSSAGGSHQIIGCDDSGQFVISHRGSTNGQFSFSDDYATTWSKPSGSNKYCYGFITRDAGMVVYGNGTDHELSVSLDQGENWNDIDVSTEFPDTGHLRPSMSHDNSSCYIFANSLSSKIYKYIKGDSNIVEWYDYGSIVVSSITISSQGNGMLVRDTDGNIYHIPKLNDPVSTKIWDGTVDQESKDQSTFFAIF